MLMKRTYHFNMKNLKVGDKLWLVKSPFLKEEYEKDIEPQLYQLIEDNGQG